ncbi:SGNH/GDSL hydrolase family protein [Nubsella zeaxanthinifaciens]|uniref:SGNH/GDSL hydrolase family protein n=1 Tax=Nubsella zeaxanthinifaciens TaxID=392412 RepID=UPI000DE50FD5|nr:SGNH/GDSL hydrolase family protein [Nubsella zeaxanthinifaciens]
MAQQISYLALGDSYTIGEAVEQSASFPHQLVALLKEKGLDVSEPKVIAKTGWTTDELKAAIEQEKINETFDLVTLLIGVNNQYRGYSPEVYKKEFTELLEMAIGFAKGEQQRVYVVSIPDWGVTEFAQQSGRNQQTISEEIDVFNEINKQITVAKQVSYLDITPASREAVNDNSLIAKDGLHPSEKMYQQWAQRLAASIKLPSK